MGADDRKSLEWEIAGIGHEMGFGSLNGAQVAAVFSGGESSPRPFFIPREQLGVACESGWGPDGAPGEPLYWELEGFLYELRFDLDVAGEPVAAMYFSSEYDHPCALLPAEVMREAFDLGWADTPS